MNTVVLISHHNNLTGLRSSLDSIYHKVGIDVLIIDDGSNQKNKPTYGNLRPHLNPGLDIKILYLEENKGISDALNIGLRHIFKLNKHKFVARLDCGDTCVANRFSIQEDYLLQHPEVGIVGSWVRWLDKDSKKEVFTYTPPCDHKTIKKKMSIRCSIIHPTVMYRLESIKKTGLYPTSFTAAEDYAYFFKIMKKNKVANIPKYLTNLEYNQEGITAKNKKKQDRNKLKIILSYGHRDLYLVYGVLYNLVLISTPDKLVHKIKTIVR
ncbi:glycosyltransferase [bacterium]|nr:glycosyltransferase [bacterium]